MHLKGPPNPISEPTWPLAINFGFPEGGLAEQPKAFTPEEFKSQSFSVPQERNKRRLISRL